SLLHELAHAAQDCAGLNPGDHELEAVYIENIYRRAAGLCQRTSYGDEPLPATMVKLCGPGECGCGPPRDNPVPQVVHAQVPASDAPLETRQVGDDPTQRAGESHQK